MRVQFTKGEIQKQARARPPPRPRIVPLFSEDEDEEVIEFFATLGVILVSADTLVAPVARALRTMRDVALFVVITRSALALRGGHPSRSGR